MLIKDGVRNDLEIDTGTLGVGTGLVEVELPSYYKTANIVETSKIRDKIEHDKLKKYDSDLPYSTITKGKKNSMDLASFRYQKTYPTPFIPTPHFLKNSSNSNQNNNTST